MTIIQKKAARAAIIEDIEEYLLRRVMDERQEAESYLAYATDEETGAVDKTDWHYKNSIEHAEKAAMIESVLKDLEKF